MQTQEILGFRGRNVVDADGGKVGKIDEIYLDTDTDKPEWLAVKTGLFGSNLTFIPAAQATEHGGNIQVPYQSDHIKAAPNAHADGELSQDEESSLYRHYGLDYGESRSDSGLPEGGTATGVTQTRGEDDAMTRSEEELRVGVARRERGRVRLRKHIVTEQVSTSVPVHRESVHVEREPITDANMAAAMDGPELTEAVHEVTITEETPVVEKQVVAKERIRLDKDVVEEQVQVNETIRKEQVEIDGDDNIQRSR